MRKHLLVSSERGVSFVLVALCVPVLLGMVALVVDLTLHRIRVHHLQKAADAAAYAASAELDGSRSGWYRAKRAALAALRQSKVLASGSDLTSLAFDSTLPGAIIDPLEHQPYSDDNPHFDSNMARVGSITVTLERGRYWVDPETSSKEYLFQASEGKVMEFGLPVYLIANAARVSVNLDAKATFFGGILGVTAFGPTSRTALASADSSEEQCVAPVAIPACALMLDPSDSEEFQFEEYRAPEQCGRELEFHNARWDAVKDDGSELLREGITRSDAYARRPYNREMPPMQLTKKTVLRGIIGLPNGENINPLEPIDPEQMRIDLINHISIPPVGTCREKARLGMRFRPMDVYHPNQGKGELAGPFLDNKELSSALSKWINSDQETPGSDSHEFRSYFGSAVSNPSQNFPFLKGLRTDEELKDIPGGILLDLASKPVGGVPVFLFPMANLLRLNFNVDEPWSDTLTSEPQDVWSNPLCHDSNIPRNDPNKARVREVMAMVIAPGKLDQNGDPEYPYCNFKRFYNHGGPAGQLPAAMTDPRIVGYVKVAIFDFGLTALETTPPGDRNPMWVPYEREDLDLSEPGEEGTTQCAYLTSGPGCSILDPNSCSFTQRDMFGNPLPGNRERMIYFPSNSAPVCASTYEQVYGGGLDSDLARSPYPPPACYFSRYSVSEFPNIWPLGVANQMNKSGLWGTVNSHCLPWGMRGCPDLHDPKCWQVRNLAPVYGCAGIRARLSCEEKAFFDVVNTPSRRPRLVGAG